MSRSSWLAGVACAISIVAVGCGAPKRNVPQVSSGSLPLRGLEGASLGRWVRVEKAKRRLTVYEDTRALRVYPIVLGGDPLGAKLYEGDNRTPEGEYRVVAKYPHPKWSRFLLIDYPTAMNRALYDWSVASGLLPGARNGNGGPGIGGQIGIHGTFDDTVNRRGENWTRGCISLVNRDVEELYSLVDIGTRVVIEK